MAELRLFASARSAGKQLPFRGEQLTVRELGADSFQGVDVALFSAGSGTSKRFAPLAVQAGATVIDNSSAFRMDPQVPLVVPEINRAALRTHQGIIANPNCCAIISITPLWPMHQVNRIARLQLATYQAASGGGAAAMQELRESTRAYLDGREYRPQVLPHPYAFNLFSHNTRDRPGDRLQRRGDQGHQGDAQDLRRSDRSASRRPACACRCCARTRVAITFECERPITPAEVRSPAAVRPRA